MTTETATTKKLLLARIARVLGTFNIAYGVLGIASALVIRFVFPQEFNPLPDSALIASVAASAWVLAQGVLLLIYGPAVLSALPDAARRLWRRIRPAARCAD